MNTTPAPQDTAQLRDALAQMVHAATHHKADIRAALRDARAALNASAPAGAWHLDSLDRSPARLIDPSGDCVALVYLTDTNRKRTPYSLDRAARIVAALNAANT